MQHNIQATALVARRAKCTHATHTHTHRNTRIAIPLLAGSLGSATRSQEAAVTQCCWVVLGRVVH